MYTNIVLVVVFLACFAFSYNNGLWSNTLLLVNLLTAGLVAMNYFEPLANWLDRQWPSFTYIWDFVSLWSIFIVAMLVLRAATDYMSPIKVRFIRPVDLGGGIVMALWLSFVATGFTTTTLHTAPLARNFLGGSFQPEPLDRMLWGAAPDRRWLAWVHRESLGSFCRLGEINPFDPRGDFILRYGKRREEFEKQLTLTLPKGTPPPGLPAP